VAISIDTEAERPPAEEGGGRFTGAASLGSTLALTMTLAIAGFAVVMAVVELTSHPTRLPPPFPSENQSAESALYLVTFGLILPGALIVASRLANAIAATRNAPALSSLTALLAATLTASILVVRALPGGGVGQLLWVVAVWWLGAIAALTRSIRFRSWDSLVRIAHLAPRLWALAGALSLGVLLAFTSLRSISPLPLVLGAVVVAAVLVIHIRQVAMPRAAGRWGVAVDVAVVVLLVLAIPDLALFVPKGPLAAFKNSVAQWHHNFFLGPTNDVLHGRAVLVGTASQYGIGALYALAAWFQVAPIGYGTLGLLDGILFALFFTGGYALLRIAGTNRWLAVPALGIGVVALVYNLEFSVGNLPQHGPLRFGLPMVLIIAATVEARWPSLSRGSRGAQLAILALSSIWALEAFAYTAVTFGAIVVFHAWTRRPASRLAWLARQAAWALIACVAAHVVFAGGTLVLSGHLPDYGWYLAYLHAFLFGSLGSLTFDFAPWSPGLPVGIGYAASAASLILLIWRRRDLVQTERVTLVALVGTTAYGIALYSYLVDRSETDIVPYVSLPLLLLATLWLSLLLRRAAGAPRAVQLGGLAFALSVALLVGATAWSSAGARFQQSPLAEAAPGGPSVRMALRRLWHLPPIDAHTARGQQLLDTYMPGERRVLIFVTPDRETEMLLRSDRVNRLPISFSTEDSFVAAHRLPALRRAVGALRAGERLLIETPGLEAFGFLRAHPHLEPLLRPVAPGSLSPLQAWLLQRIGERFDLREIHRDREGFVIAVLVRRPSGK
jgi:hypothetical protein